MGFARLAAAALLALAGGFALPPSAYAQTELTLVSNLDTSTPNSTGVQRTENAQQLSAVEAYSRVTSTNSSNLRVSLWSSASGAPDEQLATFTNPSDMRSIGVKTFTKAGPDALILQPMTSYFVVFSFRGTTGGPSADAVLDHGALSTQSGHRVNRGPFIVSDGVAVTSTPAATTDTYGVGEIIEISVTFSDAVYATTDTDFVLSVSGRKRAPLRRGSGTKTLVFGYAVQAGDSDTNGIFIGDQDRTLVGDRVDQPQNGRIASSDTDRTAILTHGQIGTASGHKVNGSLLGPQSAVSIAADQPAFTAQLDDVTFTLTRTGSTVAARDVAVALTQNRDLLDSGNLAQTVAFRGGEATATLKLLPVLFEGHTVTEESTLTATVQPGSGYVPGSPNTASTRIGVSDPAVTVRWEETAYTFAEGADATVAVILRTATGVPPRSRGIGLALTFGYASGLAGSNDLAVGSVWFVVEPSDFTPDGAEFAARKEVTLPIVDDALDEPDVTMQTAGGATWTLTGERTPAPGDTYTYSITLAIAEDTPLGTAITFGAIENNGTPRSGGITITVIEPGGAVPNASPAIATTSPVETPENGTAVATLTTAADVDDPAGLPDPFAPTWKWYSTPSGGSETEIAGESSATYTVVEADLGAALTAKASWTDGGRFANMLARAPTPVCDRTEQVRDEIVAQVSGVSTCGEVTDAHLAAITFLGFNSAASRR